MSFSGFQQTRGEGWFRIGNVEFTTTVLLITLSALSLFIWAFAGGFFNQLPLSSEVVTSGKVWQVLTWPIANTPDNALNLLISMFILFSFGSDLERQIGKRRFLRFILLLTIVPALIEIPFLLTGNLPYQIYGLSLLSSGIVVAYVAVYPSARTFGDIPFWVLVVAVLSVNALSYTGHQLWPYLVLLLLQVAGGLLLSRSFGLSRLTWIPRIPLPALFTGDETPRPKKITTKLKVINTDEINAILDKVSQHGIQSLSRDEKKRLDDYSRGSQR